MASFVPPISGNLANVTVGAPTQALLDDSGHRAVLLSELTAPTTITAVAPITSYADAVEIDGEPFIRLTPLPSPAQAAGVFRALGEAGATMPTFYFGAPGVTPASGTVAATDTIVSGQVVLLGATLGPCALAPREWARVLLDAMTRANEPDLGAWTAFLAALADGPALYVLRHTGQPPAANEMQFDFELANGDTGVMAVDGGGDLAAAVQGNLFAPGAKIRLRTPAGGIPYHTAYDSDLRSSPELNAPAADRWFEPSQFPGDVGTLLCTDLNGWFGARPPGVSLPRWHTGNRVEPLLDGLETFARLWEDLQPLRNPAGPRSAPEPDGTPFGAWLACWTFEDIELVPGEPASKFVDLVKQIDGGGYQVRLLASKLVQFRGDESDEEKLLMVVVLCLAIFGIGLASVFLQKTGKGASAETWVVVHLSAILLTMLASTQLVDAITDALDGSKAVLEALQPAGANDGRIALPSRYPARFSDNPTSSSFPASLMNELAAVNHIGVWHNKMQMLALPGGAGATAPAYVAYLGGVDVNDNRVDSWGHRWPKDYHDLHARLTGPAVADLFQTFYDRWAFDTPRLQDAEGPAASNSCPRVTPRPGDEPTPSLSEIEPAGDHIVQIARTLYRPAASHAGEAFFFAPEGEATVHDSILRAIRSAREYVYIEDQFMAPPDSDGEGDEIIEALQSAATRCKALIMVFPEGTGDPQWLFGVERRNLLMRRLQQSWGQQTGRHFLPLIHTRPLLGPSDRISARGRTVLKSPIDAVATLVRVADGVRVPDTPCWAWIEGELVLVHDKNLDTLSGESTLEVVRGPNGHHQDVWAREHAAGAPVTFTKVDDVFIHAKLVLVDDAYASIGSVNMNRRSMFHDGEISAQVVPGRLRAAIDNPVRSLRCRIWGDHLGLPPDAAEAELADPLAALPLFRRPRAAGNPLVPFELLDDMQPMGFEIETKTAFQTLGTVISGLGQIAGDLGRDAIWSTVIDPTTSLDPFSDTPPFG